MQILLTVLAGVFVFVLSQYFLKFILEPFKELKMIISKVGFSITYFADVYSNLNVVSKEDRLEMRNEIRKLAALLNAEVNSIILYSLFNKVFYLPSRKDIIEATSDLIGLSNASGNVDFTYIEKKVTNIKKYLKF